MNRKEIKDRLSEYHEEFPDNVGTYCSALAHHLATTPDHARPEYEKITWTDDGHLRIHFLDAMSETPLTGTYSPSEIISGTRVVISDSKGFLVTYVLGFKMHAE